MPATKLTTESIWSDRDMPQFDSLAEDLNVDVVVAGGGLAGITTAYLLQREGVRVALLERDRVARGDTSRTTAHLTYVTDRRLHELVKQLGRNGARAFWEAGRVAIDQIEDIVQLLQVDCGFTRMDGFLHAPSGQKSADEHKGLEQDAALASELGFDARFENRVPIVNCPGVRFAQQADFHPLAYLDGLAHAFRSQGGLIFEQTSLDSVTEEPFSISANGHTVKCDYLVVTTHNPLMGEKGVVASALLQTRLALYTSYAIGASLGKTEPALLWDTSDPYNYLRIDARDAGAYAIYGGGDVKTGQEANIEAIYARLERQLQGLLPGAKVERRWLGQVIEPDDGLPFVGKNAPHQFIATGFSGNGMTLGTVAAMMARDRFLGRSNPWEDLFRVDRSPFHGGTWQYLTENIDYPFYMVRDRLKSASRRSLESLAKGEGDIVLHEGRKVAAFRSDEGELSLCSPVCTHMKCLVHWNQADRTWDCPCHGSRFRPTGEVLSGPAEEALQKI
jgi:glycine/D-amino acid oxidase-like deaminating enzyme/nitrite reductase/ring-hydroxylating ferredoxin subunit